VRVKSKSRFDRLLIGTSAIAMAVASAIAVAQENAQKDAAKATTAPKADEDSEVSTIVVTGIRAALETAAETKRHADTFVDSVTASDVASLPDMSVAEALQRVPGVTVTRFPFGGASPRLPVTRRTGQPDPRPGVRPL
jgi:outer membrane cobalamin receptor